jgi:lipopolysaccharide assembly outer membrane protein LptD (OstA)
MQKKIFYQIFLFSLAILIIFIIVSKYLIISNNEKQISKKFDSLLSDSSSSIIKDIKYTSIDDLGNLFEITSEQAEVNFEEKHLTNMINVKAKIILANSREILISSDFAIYNNNNYDTQFKNNVLIDYEPHYINAKYLDLSFENNLLTMYDNIAYKNNDTELYADKIEMNLITKNTKIFMKNKSDKINISFNN